MISGILVIAANNVVDYKFHSIYVYNFTKYIEWPTPAPEFRIHILGGNANILDTFKSMAESKQVSGSKITVKQFSNINSLTTECDIVFVPNSESSVAAKVIDKFKGKSTLVITEKNGLCESGSCINFVLVDNRLKFEINKSAIDQAGLKVSAQLLQMGIEK